MSLNRANITWQSKDGSWNRGFYAFEYTNRDSEDFDEEWDVIYDNDRFNWVSTGHSTEEQAHDAWGGANPGYTETIEYARGNKKECDALDDLAKRFRNPAYDKAQQEKRQRAHMRKLGKQVSADYADNRFRAGLDVNVSYFTGEPGASLTTTYAGRLVQDGDWLIIEADGKKHKVYNAKTNKPYLGKKKGQLIAVSAVKPQRSSFGRGGYARW